MNQSAVYFILACSLSMQATNCAQTSQTTTILRLLSVLEQQIPQVNTDNQEQACANIKDLKETLFTSNISRLKSACEQIMNIRNQLPQTQTRIIHRSRRGLPQIAEKTPADTCEDIEVNLREYINFLEIAATKDQDHQPNSPLTLNEECSFNTDEIPVITSPTCS